MIFFIDVIRITTVTVVATAANTSLDIIGSSIINIIDNNKDLYSSFINEYIIFRPYYIFVDSLDIIYNNKDYYSIATSNKDYFVNSYIFRNSNTVFTIASVNYHFHHYHQLQLSYFLQNLTIILYFKIYPHHEPRLLL